MEQDLYIVESYLSRKPAKSSLKMAMILTGLLAAASFFYWQTREGIGARLPGSPDDVFQRYEYWRLLTGLLVHADLEHLFSNAPGFALLTGLIYGYYGLAACLLLTFAAGSFANFLSLLTYPSGTTLTGASGCVYLLAAFWLTMYVFLERRYAVTGRLMRGAGFSLIMLFPTTLVPEVSYRTHAIGFALGVLLGVIYFLRKRKYFRRFEVYASAE